MKPDVRRELALGRECYHSGDYDAARDHLRAVADVHDEFADVHNMLGVIAFDAGRVGEARRELERALELNPHYTEAALHLAICYNEAGRYGDAREVQRVAERRPSVPHTGLARHNPLIKSKISHLHAELGRSYAAIGELDLAATELIAALDICPQFGDIRLELAAVLRDTGRVEGALAELIRLREEKPGFLRGRLHLGLTFWIAGRFVEAKREWESVLERDPSNRMARFYLKMVDDQLERRQTERVAVLV